MDENGPLNLALVTSDLGPGGAQRVLSGLAGHLAARGHRVSLLTLAGPEIAPHHALHPEVALRPLNISGRSRGPLAGLANNLVRLRVLRRALHDLAPDAAVSFVDTTNVLAILACRKLGVPVLAAERSDPGRHRIGRFWSWLRNRAYPRAAVVIAQTEAAATRLEALCRCRTAVLPNPVRPPEGQAHGFGFVSVGRLSREKGHADLVRAYARLGDAARGRSLTLVGDGPERQALEALARELGVADRVVFTGTVRDVPARLLAADVFILPSLYEGFPNALCEAMVHGLAVVSTRTDLFPGDLVADGENGLLVDPGDPEALAQAMARLAGDDAERDRLGRAASGLAERLDPDRVFGLWEELIGRAAAGEL